MSGFIMFTNASPVDFNTADTSLAPKQDIV